MTTPPTHPTPEASEEIERLEKELDERTANFIWPPGQKELVTLIMQSATAKWLFAAARSHAEMAAEVESLKALLLGVPQISQKQLAEDEYYSLGLGDTALSILRSNAELSAKVAEITAESQRANTDFRELATQFHAVRKRVAELEGFLYRALDYMSEHNMLAEEIRSALAKAEGGKANAG